MKTKIKNKFYVGHPKVSSDFEQANDNPPASSLMPTIRWTRKTLADAVAHAGQILEANPGQDHCVVVQIVRIVRRKKAPVITEVVR